jgi:hypothetical protein
MSTRPDDELVTVISRWLARHVGNDELRAQIDAAPLDALSPGQRDALDELRSELDGETGRAVLEKAAREALEALALGV